MPTISWDTGVKEHDHTAAGNPATDFENPVRDGGTDADPHYRITVCDNANFGRWRIYKGHINDRKDIKINHVPGSDEYNPAPTAHPIPVKTKGEVQHDSGTDGSVDIGENALPNTRPPDNPIEEAFSEWEITITLPDGSIIKRRLRIRVIDCSHHTGPGPKGIDVPNPPVGGG
jgi:hypothetical protein